MLVMKLILALVVVVAVFAGDARAKCVSGNTVSRNDAISAAKCPDNLTVAECKCDLESEGAYCDGVTVTADLKTCHAHGAGHGGGSIKAAACCTSAKQTLASNPPFISGKRSGWVKGPVTVECPAGQHVKQCLLHTYWSPYYADKHMKASVVDGRKCVTPAACKKCGVQAICTGEAKDNRNIEQE